MRQAALDVFQDGTVIPAMPLVLGSQRKLDESSQRRLIRYYLTAGAGGLAVGVHTTQFEIRNEDVSLLIPVLKLAVDEISKYEKETGKTIVKIAGVCGETHQAKQEAEIARNLHYDVVLLSAGGLNDYTEQQLIDRTIEIAKIIPVMAFYLQPAVGGLVLSYDYWCKICDIDNVIGIKIACFNRYQTIEVMRAAALSRRWEKITLYTGNDDNIVLDLLTKYTFNHDGYEISVDFVGGLLGHWAVWTNEAVSLLNRTKQAKLDDNYFDMLKIALQVTDSNSAVFDTANNFKGCIIGIHEVLRRQGLLDSIYLLDENEVLTIEQSKEIDRVCQWYPHLIDDDFVTRFLQNYDELGL